MNEALGFVLGQAGPSEYKAPTANGDYRYFIVSKSLKSHYHLDRIVCILQML